jgi:hypothetical protein
MSSRKSAMDELVDALASTGMATGEVAGLVARVIAESLAKQPSKAALRTRKWREKRNHTPSPVTPGDGQPKTVTPHQKPSPVTVGDAPYISSSLLLNLDSDSERKKVKKEAASQRDDWPTDFADRFWQKYPNCKRKHSRRQVGEKLAKVRAVGDVTWAEVFGGLSRFAESDPEPRFIPAPEVWVNQARWTAD